MEFNFEKLASRFRKNPHEFFVEKDVQRFAELHILGNPEFDRRLLHQEYPLPVKNKKERALASRDGRPHLDMVILNKVFLEKALESEYHPNLQDNTAAKSLDILIPKPWVDLGVEFKFFRYASTKTASASAGLTTAKLKELILDLEKMLHFSSASDGGPLIKEAWIAVFEEVGSNLDLPGICSEKKTNFPYAKDKIRKAGGAGASEKLRILEEVQACFYTYEKK